MSDESTYGRLPHGLDLPRNPITQRIHRKEVWRQLVLPLVIALLLIGAGIYLAIYYQVGSLEKWAELAAIIIVGLMMVLTLIPLLLVAALIVVVTQILQQLPPAARRAQRAIEKIQRQITSGADLSVRPFMQIQSFLAMVESLFGRRK